jgi:formylglycine-generating enzyme required for sulfatase activity
MSGLLFVCVFLMVWITYRVFLYDPSGITITAEELALPQQATPEIRPPLDFEARFMFNQAREYAKNRQTDHAVAMLRQVVGVYKGTPTASEAKAALDRTNRNLPLFPDGPAIVAEHKPVEPQHGPAPGPMAVLPPSGPGPIVAVPAQPQAVQVQPEHQQLVPSQPAQPPLAPGQAVLIVPAGPVVPAPTPSTVPAPDIAKATITPRGMSPRPLPPGFKPKLEAGLHESGWSLIIVSERDNALMVLVPGGTFTMGSDDGEPDERPAHTVRMSTYYIDQHEVTNHQFRTFLEEAHWRGLPPGKWLTDEKLRAQSESAPAEFVDYHDAEAFAQWAHKRLPTEAQWEIAARSSDGRRYPWGDQPARWSRPRAFQQVDPVMSFPEDVSPYGAFDMAGNVMEWARDWYDARYYEKLRDKIIENPTGPATKSPRSIQRVVKGGSKNGAVSSRQGIDLDKRLPSLGFRCVLAVEGPEAAAIITPHSAKPAVPPSATNPTGDSPAGNIPF